MNPAATPQPVSLPSFVEAIRSDELPKFTAVLRQIGAVKEWGNRFQVDVILDANVVVRGMIWLAKKRRTPTARPEMLELIECETVRAHAPTYLIREIEVKIPQIAAEHTIPETTLREHWERYRLRITFVDVGGPRGRRTTRDRKDTPYLRLQKKLDAPIASHDHDIAAMGGRVVHMQVFGSLRSYSRNVAVEYHLKVTGVGSAAAFVGVSMLLFRGLKGASTQIGRLPKPILALGIALVILALLDPKSRKKIFAIIGGLAAGAAATLEAGVTALGPLIKEHYRAQAKAGASLGEAKAVLMLAQRRAPAVAGETTALGSR